MSPMLTPSPLSLADLVERVVAPGCGAVASFLGTVRDHSPDPRAGGRRVDHLVYEAYGPMAEAKLAEIARDTAERWPGARVAVAHRTGKLIPGEASVAIAVATPHRAAAFEACRHVIERIKRDVPIWKKEVVEGGVYWVEGPSA